GTAPRPLRGWGFLWRTAIAMICAAIVVAIVFYVKNRTNPSSPLVATRRSAPASSPQNKPAASPPSAASAPSGHPAFALLLGVGVERGGVRSVNLPRGLKDLEVQILLPANETGKNYDVEVSFPYGSAVKTFSGLIPEDAYSQKLVRFSMPAANLESGLYTFQLYREGGAQSHPIAIDQAFIKN
ncbi:MAG: hypothetical protein KGM47_12195, partial [Acidobacteriota bacterium]|nr:hypothetical protein [Acidobacteriota bacterium]